MLSECFYYFFFFGSVQTEHLKLNTLNLQRPCCSFSFSTFPSAARLHFSLTVEAFTRGMLQSTRGDY